MTIQVVSAASGAEALSNSVRTRYLADYWNGAQMVRLYDQLAKPIGKDMSNLARGSSVQINFLSDMEPGTTAIPETVDITPQALTDGTASVTPTSRAEALQGSELLLLQAYTNYGAERYKAVGKNMMESIEILARDVATKGNWVKRAVARASLDAGTSTHRASDSLFTDVSTMFATAKVPGFETQMGPNYAAIMHPAAYHDIREGGNVVEVAKYQNGGIILRHELGSIGPFRLVVSPWAKVFGSAGADNDDVIASTLVSAVSALDHTLNIATTTHLDSSMNQWWTIGTEETDSTHYPKNELVYAVSYNGSIVTVIGEASNGGFRFDHAAGTAVRNADNVYTIVFGGPESLVKIYQPSIGEFGMPVGPKKDGTVDQFWTLGWKFYGNYGLPVQNRILRAEVAATADA